MGQNDSTVLARTWRLTVPDIGQALVKASTFNGLSTEVRNTLGRLKVPIPTECHGNVWTRWIQRAMWGEGASIMGDWKLEQTGEQK